MYIVVVHTLKIGVTGGTASGKVACSPSIVLHDMFYGAVGKHLWWWS